MTSSVDDTEDTIVVLLARMEESEDENNILQETVDVLLETMGVLQGTVDELNDTIIALQITDNATNDRLQEVETDLQGDCIHVFLRFKIFGPFFILLNTLVFFCRCNHAIKCAQTKLCSRPFRKLAINYSALYSRYNGKVDQSR